MTSPLPGATVEHEHGTRAALERAAERGVHPGETLASVVDEFKRQVIVSTIAAHPSMASAARAMGITRECLYKTRLRMGLPIGSPKANPVPDDWRKRLEQ